MNVCIYIYYIADLLQYVLTEQLLCVREHAGTWDDSSEKGEDAGPQGAHRAPSTHVEGLKE